MTETEQKELEHLRRQEIIWKKVCEFERRKWMNHARIYSDKISDEVKDHLQNIEKLLEVNDE